MVADYCRRHLASVPAYAWHSLMRRRRRFPIRSQYPRHVRDAVRLLRTRSAASWFLQFVK